MDSREDLRRTTLEWSRQWWDATEHMVWNPDGGFGEDFPGRSVHLVPNTAWLAYAMLATGDGGDRAEAIAAIRQLITLQYEAADQPYHGTYRRFLEQPDPPEDAIRWVHYDPNWRQFVGTTFALILEDFTEVLDQDMVESIERSIGLACDGEADDRIPPSYSNPALMRAWLDCWYGRRCDRPDLFTRGLAFAERIVADFDVYGAFAEFNSPTYYGIDLYALRLWRLFPPDPYFEDQGTRLEDTLWRSAGQFFNATIGAYGGPFTRSYHPDARRSVALFSLWIWGLLGRGDAPLPDLDADVIDHSHDLMAGPLFARLAGFPRSYGLADFTTFGGEHFVEQELSGGRHVTAWMSESLMIGAESSARDWGETDQFVPFTAIWQTTGGSAVLWMVNVRTASVVASANSALIETPGTAGALILKLSATDEPRVIDHALNVSGLRVEFLGDVDAVHLTRETSDRFLIEVEGGGTGGHSTRLQFSVLVAAQDP